MSLTLRRTATALAVLLVATTTLTQAPSQADRAAETAWSCIVCGEAGGTDVLLNLLLFAPLGVGLRLQGFSAWRTLGVALALTLTIESLQATVLAGRDASLGDVLANTLGALAGWWLWPRLLHYRRPTPPSARRAAGALWAASSVVWLMSGWGLHPEGSRTGPWVGQIGRIWSGHMAYPGRVETISLNGLDVPNDPLAAVPSLGHPIAVAMVVTRGDTLRPTRPISLLRVVDGVGALQVSATQRGEALLVSVRTRAARWRVRTPTWRHDEAMRTPLDAPQQLQWRWDSAGVSLARGVAGDAALATQSSLTPSVGLGWVFVHPFAAAISQDALGWTALWLALWSLPFAWCLRWLSRGEAGLGMVASLASFSGASLLTGMPVRGVELAVMGVWLVVGCIQPRPSGRGTR